VKRYARQHILNEPQTYWVAGYQPLLVTGRKYGSSFHLGLGMLLVTGSQREKQFISCSMVLCNTSILQQVICKTNYDLSWTHETLYRSVRLLFCLIFKLLDWSPYPKLGTSAMIHVTENPGTMWWYFGLCFSKSILYSICF
jgi:hypothetical protein